MNEVYSIPISLDSHSFSSVTASPIFILKMFINVSIIHRNSNLQLPLCNEPCYEKNFFSVLRVTSYSVTDNCFRLIVVFILPLETFVHKDMPCSGHFHIINSLYTRLHLWTSYGQCSWEPVSCCRTRFLSLLSHSQAGVPELWFLYLENMPQPRKCQRYNIKKISHRDDVITNIPSPSDW